MSLHDQVESFLRRYRLQPRRLLVAVSGGADSTALLTVLQEAAAERFEVVSLHVRHGLRGESSDADARWIDEYARSLGVAHHAVDGSPPLRERARVGIEAAARNIRYELLEQFRSQLDADFVVTAHHLDDEAETVLLRLITGSGPQRLTGIAPVDEIRRLLRPFLFTRRHSIESFLEERHVQPRHDESNASVRFVRNRIRHELIPFLSSLNPRIVETLAETAAQGRELREALDHAVDIAAATSLRRNETQSVIERDERLHGWILRALLLREILRLDPEARDISAADLRRLEEGSESRVTVTDSLELIRKPHALRLQRRMEQPSAPAVSVELSPEQVVQIATPACFVRVRAAAAEEEPQRDSFQLPELAPERFLLRNRQEGDRFQPLGLPHDKKLKDVLINRKIDLSTRGRLLILTHGELIVWVSGVGISERFRVRDRNRRWFRIVVEDRVEEKRDQVHE